MRFSAITAGGGASLHPAGSVGSGDQKNQTCRGPALVSIRHRNTASMVIETCMAMLMTPASPDRRSQSRSVAQILAGRLIRRRSDPSESSPHAELGSQRAFCDLTPVSGTWLYNALPA